jgi:hypothetical protein
MSAKQREALLQARMATGGEPDVMGRGAPS